MDSDASQLFQVNLDSLESAQGSAEAMAAIDRQELDAVIITILDLFLLVSY